MAEHGEAVEAALKQAAGRRALERRMAEGDDLAWVELAELRIAAEDGDGAVGVLSELLEAQPGSAEGWATLAKLFESVELPKDALGCWQQAVAAGARAEHMVAMGTLLQRSGDRGAAAGCYVRALNVDPDLIVAHHNLAALYVSSGRLEGAAEHYRQVVRRDPGHVRAWGNLGVVLRRLGRSDEAIDALEQAVLRDASYGRGWANLASAKEAANDLDGAAEAVERALALAPKDPLGQLTSARVDRRRGRFDSAEQALIALVGVPLSPDLAARAQVELGFVLDRQGTADRAFAAFEAGQAGLAGLPEARAINPTRYPALLDRIGETAPALLAATPPSDPDPAPVFVVGFPRSGTTLTEQVIAAHPAFKTSDEAPLLESALSRVAVDVGTAYPEGLVGASDDQWLAVRAAYRAAIPAGPGRFVDKFPLNIAHLPAIRMLFPDARVVVVLRDPRDVVLSNFMQDFVPNEAMVHCSTLRRAAGMYARVMGLWQGWAQSFPDVHTVRYEDLVDDLEGTARALIAALGEPWHDGVLEYHLQAAKRRISTPSHQDVSKPIFRRSLGRWRRYEDHMMPVLPVLAPFAEAFGYER